MAASHTLTESTAATGTIAERFYWQAERTPNQLAVVTQNRRIEYRELAIEVRRLANVIASVMDEPDAVVAFILDSGYPRVLAMMACFDAGAVFTPLEATYSEEHLTQLLVHANAKIILTDTANIERIAPIVDGHDVINVDALPTTVGPSSRHARPLTDLAYLRYTSGSTGAPKGVMQSEASTIFAADAFATIVGLDSTHRVGMFQPFWPMQIIASLLHGATWHHIDPRFNSDVIGWLIEEQITALSIPVAAYRRIINELNDEFLPRLSHINLSGEVVYRGDIERIRPHVNPQCRFINSYGASECSRISRYEQPVGDDVLFNIIPAGYATPGREIVLLKQDGDTNRGEVAVRSEFLPIGYWRNDALTQTMFAADPNNPDKKLYRTGDVGVIDESGCLHIRGRIDHQVKIDGFRVLPPEIEELLLAEPDIAEAAVITDPRFTVQTKMAAFLKPHTGLDVKVPDLRARLRARVPHHMVPHRFYVEAELPRGYTGKVDRRALAELLEAMPTEAETSATAPETAEQREMVGIWRDLLSVEHIGIDDDFFDLGGDSFSAAQMLLSVEQHFGVVLPTSVLLEATTVRDVVQRLDQTRPTKQRSLIPIRTEGKKRPLFFVHGTQCYRYLRQWVADGHPIYGLAQHFDGAPVRYATFTSLATRYIDEIRSVQPSGPYALAGHSLGGTLAHEVACQLAAAGETISLLALLDTAAPLGDTSRPYANWMMDRCRQMASQRDWRGGLKSLVAHADQRARCHLAHLRGKRLTPSQREFYVDEVVYGSLYRRANRQHRPNRLDAGAVYLQATVDSRDGAQAWRAHLTHELEVQTVPGDHFSMLHPPHFRASIRTLNALLDRA